MPFKIIRADLVKMNCDAIVNTANEYPIVGPGCDTAVYNAAGYEELLQLRREIGIREEGSAFITPGFKLPARYIIHTVSPLFLDGKSKEEDKLRSCYRNSLAIAKEKGLKSIAFPLISTGSFGYPKEEGMRIAIDEIYAFLMNADLMVYLVVFGEKATALGTKIFPDLEEYIDRNYVEQKNAEEYGESCDESPAELPSMARETLYSASAAFCAMPQEMAKEDACLPCSAEAGPGIGGSRKKNSAMPLFSLFEKAGRGKAEEVSICNAVADEDEDYEELISDSLKERMTHMSDSFAEYLMYLIESKGMSNAEVYKRGIVDKKIFSKIKNNPNYHPGKIVAMSLCVGAKLNMDETRDLLARAGYALSPCDKTDIIFSYFIENGIYDMIELDIMLEEFDLPCLIS